MNEKNFNVILDALAEQLKEKDNTIFLQKYQIDELTKRLVEAEKHIKKGEEK